MKTSVERHQDVIAKTLKTVSFSVQRKNQISLLGTRQLNMVPKHSAFITGHMVESQLLVVLSPDGGKLSGAWHCENSTTS